MSTTQTKFQASIETKHPRVAADTDELAEVLQNAEVGDGLTVGYMASNGMTLTTNAEIDELDEKFGDIHFGDNYLHVNLQTGDYHFQDDRRESPEDGYHLQSVTLYKVGA